MRNKLYIIGAGVALVLVIAGGWMLYRSAGESVPMADRFDDKIVYTTDLSVDAEALEAHCKAEGGLFNECGSACPTYADTCVSVCAYTCDDL